MNDITYEQPYVDGIMFSKWNDTIFIDNYNNYFTAYQWYCDNVPLIDDSPFIPENHGVTDQILSLDGDFIDDAHVFSCRCTTKDGTYVYTKPMAFCFIPRSADNPPDPYRPGLDEDE